MPIDLNCDLGEGIGNDAALMPLITSANIACGLHAGDAVTMWQAVRLAKQHGVAIGAHPGYADRENFGRTSMSLALDAVRALLLYQIGALMAIAKAEGVALTHVKPHGALYNDAAKDMALAQVIAETVKQFDANLILVGLAGSRLIEAGRAIGLRVAREGFPDRAYNSDGSLMSRSLPGAIITDVAHVAAHAFELVHGGLIDTLCIHGDNAHAVACARAVRVGLEQNNVHIERLHID